MDEMELLSRYHGKFVKPTMRTLSGFVQLPFRKYLPSLGVTLSFVCHEQRKRVF